MNKTINDKTINDKTIKIKLPYEKIDFDNWYLNHAKERDDFFGFEGERSSYLQVHSTSYIKKLNDLPYPRHGKKDLIRNINIYDVRYFNEIYGLGHVIEEDEGYVHLPLLVVENEIVNYYELCVETDNYVSSMENAFRLIFVPKSKLKPWYKTAISIINEFLGTEVLLYKKDYFKCIGWFDPRKNETDLATQSIEYNEYIKKKFLENDIVKLVNNDNGTTHFGVFKYVKNYDIPYKYLCLLINPENATNDYYMKYFLPMNPEHFDDYMAFSHKNLGKYKWDFLKADLSELNENEKKIANTLQENNMCKIWDI